MRIKTIHVLVYYGKHDQSYWLADTAAHRDAAFKILFGMLDGDQCYEDEDEKHLAKARAGDIRAIRGLLESRRNCEYEEWELVDVDVVDPVGADEATPPGNADFSDFDVYQEAAHSLAVYPEDAGISYTALGLAGEAGEVADHAKKVIRDDDGIVTPVRRAAMLKELGDALWYVAETATCLGANLSQIAADNMEKLFGRKRRGVLKGDGDNR
jgi:NTP pyrophosphatase (non-canonical NTP hydrolase)